MAQELRKRLESIAGNVRAGADEQDQFAQQHRAEFERIQLYLNRARAEIERNGDIKELEENAQRFERDMHTYIDLREKIAELQQNAEEKVERLELERLADLENQADEVRRQMSDAEQETERLGWALDALAEEEHKLTPAVAQVEASIVAEEAALADVTAKVELVQKHKRQMLQDEEAHFALQNWSNAHQARIEENSELMKNVVAAEKRAKETARELEALRESIEAVSVDTPADVGDEQLRAVEQQVQQGRQQAEEDKRELDSGQLRDENLLAALKFEYDSLGAVREKETALRGQLQQNRESQETLEAQAAQARDAVTELKTATERARQNSAAQQAVLEGLKAQLHAFEQGKSAQTVMEALEGQRVAQLNAFEDKQQALVADLEEKKRVKAEAHDEQMRALQARRDAELEKQKNLTAEIIQEMETRLTGLVQEREALEARVAEHIDTGALLEQSSEYLANLQQESDNWQVANRALREHLKAKLPNDLPKGDALTMENLSTLRGEFEAAKATLDRQNEQLKQAVNAEAKKTEALQEVTARINSVMIYLYSQFGSISSIQWNQDAMLQTSILENDETARALGFVPFSRDEKGLVSGDPLWRCIPSENGEELRPVSSHKSLFVYDLLKLFLTTIPTAFTASLMSEELNRFVAAAEQGDELPIADLKERLNQFESMMSAVKLWSSREYVLRRDLIARLALVPDAFMYSAVGGIELPRGRIHRGGPLWTLLRDYGAVMDVLVTRNVEADGLAEHEQSRGFLEDMNKLVEFLQDVATGGSSTDMGKVDEAAFVCEPLCVDNESTFSWLRELGGEAAQLSREQATENLFSTYMQSFESAFAAKERFKEVQLAQLEEQKQADRQVLAQFHEEVGQEYVEAWLSYLTGLMRFLGSKVKLKSRVTWRWDEFWDMRSKFHDVEGRFKEDLPVLRGGLEESDVIATSIKQGFWDRRVQNKDHSLMQFEMQMAWTLSRASLVPPERRTPLVLKNIELALFNLRASDLDWDWEKAAREGRDAVQRFVEFDGDQRDYYMHKFYTELLEPWEDVDSTPEQLSVHLQQQATLIDIFDITGLSRFGSIQHVKDYIGKIFDTTIYQLLLQGFEEESLSEPQLDLLCLSVILFRIAGITNDVTQHAGLNDLCNEKVF